MTTQKIATKHTPQKNRLCFSCRRACKQAANAVIANCPRYYPINRKQKKHEFEWKQQELELF